MLRLERMAFKCSRPTIADDHWVMSKGWLCRTQARLQLFQSTPSVCLGAGW